MVEVQYEVVGYFTEHFTESMVDRPQLDGIEFVRISGEEDLVLSCPFQEAEIKEVVLSFDGNKILRLDFNFSFFKRCWDMMKGEVGVMFDQFFCLS